MLKLYMSDNDFEVRMERTLQQLSGRMKLPQPIRDRVNNKRWGVVSAAVMEDNQLSTLSKALYSLMTTYESKRSLEIWPSIGRMADCLYVSQRTISRAIKELEEHRVIIRYQGTRPTMCTRILR